MLGFGVFRRVSRDYLGGCFSRPQAVGRSGQSPQAKPQGQDITAGLAPAVAQRSAVEMAGFPRTGRRMAGAALRHIQQGQGNLASVGGRAASFEVSGVPGRASGPERVAKANELCRLTARSWDFCCECSIVVIIENPYRSLLWRCIAVEHILRSEQAIVVQCDFCIMGGSK